MTKLEIQDKNFIISNSCISEVNLAKKMTEYTKKNVLIQASTSLLAQVNSMNQAALSLLA